MYLIIYPDGKTNVPEPKVKSKSDKTAVETILDLAIQKFNLTNGEFEVANRSKTPFDIHGQNLHTSFVYELAGPRYRGTMDVKPLDAKIGSNQNLPVDVAASFILEKNRVQILEGHLITGASKIDVSGGIDDLVNIGAGCTIRRN